MACGFEVTKLVFQIPYLPHVTPVLMTDLSNFKPIFSQNTQLRKDDGPGAVWP